MEIKKTIEKIPGGMVVVPLFTAMVLNTFFPSFLRIGGFSEALFVDGTLVLIALFLVCIGAQLKITKIGRAVKKGTTLLLLKWGVAAVISMIAFIFMDENSLFLGLAPIAIIAAMSNSSGGMYLAISGEFGSEEDLAAYPILALNDGPFLSMIALSIFGFMGFVDGIFGFTDFLSVLIPILVGAILGNLDEEMRTFLSKGSDMIIPFFSFAIGMGIDLSSIIDGGLVGILLGVMTVFITGGLAYFVYSKIGWNPIVGASEGSTAGNAIATPAVLAAANPAFAAQVEIATVQIAACVVTSLVLLPIFITFLAKRLEKKGKLVKGGDPKDLINNNKNEMEGDLGAREIKKGSL
ncbi:2-keto-3-deoxygluconate permease [Virgibacillus halotolerans]|uniref:2-keto-3-deoxygluconate permease n=1 Tax=Virgibacillus halotolerans TaxID=1071053 RepID=UPI0019601680|nr:2-keto-3-deoxygluconate permease [Virgibacillus halotolerans]MBM7599107.1 2-keto-3-deoxygluconate permease [Virgibacillus halotolerans]